MALRIDPEKIGSLLTTQSTEVTDPGIPFPTGRRDEYIPPQKNDPKLSSLSANAWRPIRWAQSLLARKRVTEEVAELIAKIERLPSAPDTAIQYFFDKDLPRLVDLSNLQPLVVGQMLRKREVQNPWLQLVQIACGDSKAFVSALDSLC